jgi:hypothetical protein
VKQSGRDTEELEQTKGRNRQTEIHERERERERERRGKSVTLGEGQSIGDVFCVQMMATSIVEEEELKVWFSFSLE